MIKQIGWIGTGILGTEIVKVLLKNGVNVSVYNRTKEKAYSLMKYGAKIEGSILDLFLQFKVVFCCLGSQEAFDSLINNSELNKINRDLILVDISTISPKDSINNAKKLGLLNIKYIESPVSGGKEGAINGIMTAICSGDSVSFGYISNILNYFCTNIHYVGKHGNAQKLKIINNLAESINLICASEVILLGLKLGFDISTLKAVLTTARGRSVYMDLLLERLFNKITDVAVTLDVRTKDLSLAQELLNDTNLETQLSSVVIELFKKTKEIYGPSEDQSKCFDIIQSILEKKKVN